MTGGTSTEHSEPSVSVPPWVIRTARLFRVRTEDVDNWDEIVAQLELDRGEETLSVFGRANLERRGRRIRVYDRAWEAAEQTLGELPGAAVASDLETIESLQSELKERALLYLAATKGKDHTLSSADPSAEQSRERNQRQSLSILLRALGNALREVMAVAEQSAGETTATAWRGQLADFYQTYLARVARAAVAPSPAAPSIDGRPANSFPDAPYIEPLPKDGTKGHLLEREALRYGFSSVRYPNGSFVVSDADGNRMSFKWGRSPIASGVALSICSYKEATRRLLQRLDVPVPRGRVFSVEDVDNALDFADRIGYPVVAKPVAGLRGIGVVADIRSRSELIDALDMYRRSQLGNDDFVIEEHVPGDDHRIVVIDGKVVAAVVREPASVVGDGVHTVADLIEYKNRARLENPHLSSRLIKFTEPVEYQLRQAGLTYASIPDAGQVVTLANSANLSVGGDSFEVAHELHPSIKEVAVRAVQAVPGLGFCGLDMLIEDRTKPITEQRATVIELNAHAAIGSAQYPMWGTPFPVAHEFFRASASLNNIPLPESRRDDLAMRLVVRGRVTGVGFLRWFQRRAARFGVSGYIEAVSPTKVRAHVQGDADAVAALGYLAAVGNQRGLPTSVTMTPVASVDMEGFQIGRPQVARVKRKKAPWTIRRIRRALMRRVRALRESV